MRLWTALYISLVLITSSLADPATAPCPLSGGDACHEWRLEKLDEELAALISGPSEWIAGMPEQSRDKARSALNEAQKQWIQFRQAECRRLLTWSFGTA